MKPKFSILALIGLALLATPAVAKPGKGKGKGGPPGHADTGKGKGGPPGHAGKGHKGKGGPPAHAGNGNQGAAHKFGADERRTLIDFFAPDKRKSLPPGLRKNLERGKPLPPGWQKKVAAGQVIDAGWLDLMTRIPYDDVPGIRRTPGTRLYYHDNRLIRVNPETRVILDVINLLTR